MGDFGQVGTANLWKSGPLFSTGTSNAELMVTEPRLNLRSRLMRCPDGFVGEMAGKDGIELAPSCPQHLQSPGALLPQKWWGPCTGLERPGLPLAKARGGMS